MIDNNLFVIDEEKEKKLLEKYANFYFLLDIWLRNIEGGKTVGDFFRKRNYQTIAIYGMAALGKHLETQLAADNIDIIYIIDSGLIEYEGRAYRLESIDLLPVPDVIVITPLSEYISIKEMIKGYINTDIISLEEVILSL